MGPTCGSFVRLNYIMYVKYSALCLTQCWCKEITDFVIMLIYCIQCYIIYSHNRQGQCTCVMFFCSCAVCSWSDNVRITLALFNDKIAFLFNVLEQFRGFYLLFQILKYLLNCQTLVLWQVILCQLFLFFFYGMVHSILLGY